MNRNEISGPGKTGDKHGEAYVTGILVVVAFGDGSLDAAKKAGGITEVHRSSSTAPTSSASTPLGCTEVHGSNT